MISGKEVAAISTAEQLRATDVWTSHVDSQTLIEIGQERRGPCVSLFYSIAGDGEGSNSRAMADLIAKARSLLIAAGVGYRRTSAILRPALSVIDAPGIWKSGSRGVAVFASPDMFAVVLTGVALATRAVIARRFVTRPLLPALEDLTDFEVRSALNSMATGPRNGRIVVEIAPVLAAAHCGRVAELYIDRDSQVWGCYNSAASAVTELTAMGPDADDLIDLASLKAVAGGGRVHVTDRLEAGGVRVPMLAVLSPSRPGSRGPGQ